MELAEFVTGLSILILFPLIRLIWLEWRRIRDSDGLHLHNLLLLMGEVILLFVPLIRLIVLARLILLEDEGINNSDGLHLHNLLFLWGEIIIFASEVMAICMLL